MSDTTDVDFGPLEALIGTWTGTEGTDVSPEPDGTETNPYFEAIIFSPVGKVTNAESQRLVAVQYRQVVSRKATGKVFHDESGYWMWEAATGTVMHSLSIPRGVCVLAGGTYQGETDDDGRAVLEVSAAIDDETWPIVQSPFMLDNACTKSFRHRVAVGDGRLSYSETTMVDIYGKLFTHTDDNELVKG